MKELLRLKLNITSKYNLYWNAFMVGACNMGRFHKDYSMEYIDGECLKHFRQFCYDFDLTDVVDGQHINYVDIFEKMKNEQIHTSEISNRK